MKNQNWWNEYFNGWVIGGGILLTVILLAVLWGILNAIKADPERAVVVTAKITPIPGYTSTPDAKLFTPTPTSTATADPSLPVNTEVISTGSYVQISGTDGAGLRLREEPGKQSNPLFIGAESEVFQVKDGPVEADGITWWYLVASYDASRSGWAAANYLSVIQNP